MRLHFPGNRTERRVFQGRRGRVRMDRNPKTEDTASGIRGDFAGNQRLRQQVHWEGWGEGHRAPMC